MAPKWFEVEKPTKLKIMVAPTKPNLIKYTIIGIVVGILLNFVLEFISSPVWSDLGVTVIDLPLNALFIFVVFGTIFVPTVVGGVISVKKQCPPYGFLTVLGFFISDLLFYFSGNKFLWWYGAFTTGFLILCSLPRQGNYTLKWGHLIYFFIMGGIVSYLNIVITDRFLDDVWCYLQFAFLQLMIIIIISLKIRQWGFSYMIGWAACAFIYCFIPNELVNGIYYLFTPALLTGAVLYFFYQIWRPTAKKLNKIQVQDES